MFFMKGWGVIKFARYRLSQFIRAITLLIEYYEYVDIPNGMMGSDKVFIVQT